MSASETFDRALIAPCGINCGTCMAYLRTRNRCLGCRADFASMRATCLRCKIRNCELLEKTESKYCSECNEFPCARIKHIDKRYRTKYRTGLIDNLVSIKEKGIESFLRNEEVKWTCPKCGKTLSVHRTSCLFCS